ncbi:MAG: threonine ammonia-lyase [Bryobacteraceae bacterium]
MVTLDDIRAAAGRISGLAHRTPLMTSRTFDLAAGRPVRFKCENLQRGGAFKIRGAANFVFSLEPAELRAGVIGVSSGNHAQALAIAARSVGARATIVMPSDAPRGKLAATRGYGAEVIFYDRMRERREEVVARVAAERGGVIVPPFDHPWIVAGQGTAALELLAEGGDVETLVVPVGGGGLIAGCATAAKAMRPGIRIYGVEPERAADTFESLRRAERVEIAPPETIADGLRATRPGEVTFPIVQRLVDGVVLVSEDEIRAAVRFLLLRMKLLVEPSGAVGAAALLAGRIPGAGPVGVIVSGGNIDPEQLAAIVIA